MVCVLCVALYCNVILVDQRGGRIVGSAGGGALEEQEGGGLHVSETVLPG